MSRAKPFKTVIISCRGPKTLRRQIAALAKQEQRTSSDWLRRALTHLVKTHRARRDDAAA